MKIMFISDIHGSAYYMEKIVEIFNNENYQHLYILGDVLYHGPRNDLPTEYNPKRVIELLKMIKKKITYIRGNCDAEVDEMVLKCKMSKNKIITLDGKKVFLTHGHHYNKDNLPNKQFDIMMYGHFHVPFIMSNNSHIIMSPGSISIPKENSLPSYIKYEDKEFEIVTIF